MDRNGEVTMQSTIMLPQRRPLYPALANTHPLDERAKVVFQNIPWEAPRMVPTTCRGSLSLLEQTRNRGQVNLTVWHGGLDTGGQLLVPAQRSSSVHLIIERERWLAFLQQLEAGTRWLVELPKRTLRCLGIATAARVSSPRWLAPGGRESAQCCLVSGPLDAGNATSMYSSALRRYTIARKIKGK